MIRGDVEELHYITHIANVPSILQHGILSHRRASSHEHSSVANASVQQYRARRRLPSGRMLHEYANLYFHARNPMMYAIQEHHSQLVVLRINPDALDLNGVIVADGNAAHGFTAFWDSREGLLRLDRELVYAESWTDPDAAKYLEKKRVKCSEVLVPDFVPRHLIVGVHTSCLASANHETLTGSGVEVTIDEHLFFRAPRIQGAM